MLIDFMRSITREGSHRPTNRNGFASKEPLRPITVPQAIELLRKNGINFPGVHIRNIEELSAQHFSQGQYVVKAAVNTKGKREKGMVIFCSSADLRTAVNCVFENMQKAGEDPAQGVIIQEKIQKGTEVLVSVSNSPYETLTTVKLGGAQAEEQTKTIRFLGELNREKLHAALLGIPGIGNDISIPQLVDLIKVVQRTVETNPEIKLIEINPVICLSTCGTYPVDIRVFTEEVLEKIKDLIPQEKFEEQIDRLLNPKKVVLIKPGETQGEEVRYCATVNVLRSESEDRAVLFVHPTKESITVQLDGGKTVNKKCYKTLADLIEKEGIPDVVIAPLTPEPTIEIEKTCSRFGIPIIMIGAGFGEVGEQGEQFKRELVALFKDGGNVGIGPNTYGVVGHDGFLGNFDLYECFDGSAIPLTGGRISVFTQGGGVNTKVVGALIAMGVPIDCAIASGNSYGIRMHQAAKYLGKRRLNAEFYYVEGEPGPVFIEEIRKRTTQRGVVILKGGRHAENLAVRSHTDATSGSGAAFELAAKEAGAIIVTNDDIVPYLLQMLDKGMVRELARKIKQAREEGKPEPGIMILTQSGSDGVITTDLTLDTKTLSLAKADPRTVQGIQSLVGRIITVREVSMDVGPMPRVKDILEISSKDPNMGLTCLSINKVFIPSLIPKNGSQDAVLLLTNDPHFKGVELARKQGWIVFNSKLQMLEAMAIIYENARWLADKLEENK